VVEQIVPNANTFAPLARPALVNGAAGLVIGPPERPIAVCGFEFEDDRISEINLVLDREKLPR
jgi:RNA polymerase sigma-70 factor (ECF subfamily)